jgi:hypothetical protein
MLWIVIFCCGAFSCEDEIRTNIPWAPVSLTLYLNDIDKKLLNINQPQLYTAQKPNGHNEQTDRFGYGGILVTNTGAGTGINLLAYDAACQVEADRTAVAPDESGLHAVCPKCGAVYSIVSGGAPVSGAKYGLQRYTVTRGTLTNSFVVTN